jgi:Concanavalin A-like lectin/glucanases superfamily
MFWGKPGANPSTGGQSVFDPAAGFATVYHLAESPTSAVGGYKDATSSANHATAASLDPTSQVNGVIGMAKSFSGNPTSVDRALTAALPQGFAGNSSFTVSFWMRCRMVPQRQGILDFGTYGLQQNMHFLLLPDTTIQFGAYNENPSGAGPASWQSTIKVPQAPERWTHFTTVYGAAQGSLMVYVNGARADSLSVPAMAIDASGGLRIGKPIGTAIQPPVEYPFNGELDEIRFVNRALPAERILLDYTTQRP